MRDALFTLEVFPCRKVGNFMKVKRFMMVFSLLFVVSACSSVAKEEQAQNPNAATPDEASAMALYKNNCLSCHAVDLGGIVGPSLQQVGSKFIEEQLVEIIHDGEKGMPAFEKMLNTDEIDVLAKWLSQKK